MWAPLLAASCTLTGCLTVGQCDEVKIKNGVIKATMQSNPAEFSCDPGYEYVGHELRCFLNSTLCGYNEVEEWHCQLNFSIMSCEDCSCHTPSRDCSRVAPLPPQLEDERRLEEEERRLRGHHGGAGGAGAGPAPIDPDTYECTPIDASKSEVHEVRATEQPMVWATLPPDVRVQMQNEKLKEAGLEPMPVPSTTKLGEDPEANATTLSPEMSGESASQTMAGTTAQPETAAATAVADAITVATTTTTEATTTTTIATTTTLDPNAKKAEKSNGLLSHMTPEQQALLKGAPAPPPVASPPAGRRLEERA